MKGRFYFIADKDYRLPPVPPEAPPAPEVKPQDEELKRLNEEQREIERAKRERRTLGGPAEVADPGLRIPGGLRLGLHVADGFNGGKPDYDLFINLPKIETLGILPIPVNEKGQPIWWGSKKK